MLSFKLLRIATRKAYEHLGLAPKPRSQQAELFEKKPK
jgi:hypothetical protein